MPDFLTATKKICITIMKLVYCEKWGRKVAAVDDRLVKTDRIKPGQVLHVMSCFAYAPELSKDDVLCVVVRSGGKDVCVRYRGSPAIKRGMSILNPFLVGEGDQVIGCFPDSDVGDTIELCIIGVLYSLDEWRKL